MRKQKIISAKIGYYNSCLKTLDDITKYPYCDQLYHYI